MQLDGQLLLPFLTPDTSDLRRSLRAARAKWKLTALRDTAELGQAKRPPPSENEGIKTRVRELQSESEGILNDARTGDRTGF